MTERSEAPRGSVEFKFVCFAAAGPVHGVGLVYVLGGLWPANIEVPESEPGHRPGSAGEVSAQDEWKAGKEG